MLNQIMSDAKSEMDKAIEGLKKHLTTIRTGRAHISLLDPVRVDYYGTPTPVSQVASVSIPDARMLVIKPWEKPLLKVIEKAIMDANLGITPTNDGDVIRVSMPPLTEERRKEFVKQARARGEEAKVSVRNARRDANEMLKDAKAEGSIAEDEEKRGLKSVQDATDHAISEIDKLLAHKESDIMTV